MKCVHCGKDNTFKDRTGGKCGGCGKAFAFEPKSGDVLTDGAFHRAIQRASADGRVEFGRSQLYHEVDRSKSDAPSMAMTVALLLFGSVLFGVLGLFVWVLWLGWPALLVWRLWKHWTWVPQVWLKRSDFDGYLQRWTRAHGRPRGLIEPARQLPGPKGEDELLGYSFERVVVTDSAETAEVLLANDFHFENSCAVLSATGHPKHAFATVLKMVRANPNIQVFALHDCTPDGCRLAWTLASDPAWFSGIGRVVDVGLRPGQVDAMKLRRAPADRPAESHPALSAAEVAWLGRWRAELGALPVEQLVKRLYRVMTQREDLARSGADGGGSGGDGGDGGLFILPGGTSDGGGDAFG